MESKILDSKLVKQWIPKYLKDKNIYATNIEPNTCIVEKRRKIKAGKDAFTYRKWVNNEDVWLNDRWTNISRKEATTLVLSLGLIHSNYLKLLESRKENG